MRPRPGVETGAKKNPGASRGFLFLRPGSMDPAREAYALATAFLATAFLAGAFTTVFLAVAVAATPALATVLLRALP